MFETQAASLHLNRLLDSHEKGDWIEVYLVGRFTGRAPLGVCCRSGIAVTRDAPATVLAHELGHALGLADVYDKRPNQTWADGGKIVDRCLFQNQDEDWAADDGRGFYPSGTTYSKILQGLLMYGYRSMYSPSAYDIPSGAVWGLPANSSSAEYVSVGASGIKQNNGEVYSE